MITNFNNLLTDAVALLRQANTICILTGAGISAESGIPTFRDKQNGLWENYRAEDLATIAAFERDPNLVWSWYQWRRHLVKDKKPNPAHIALAQWQKATLDSHQIIHIITQNVDDLHEQAGSDVTHLHGHLWKNKCSQCQTAYLDSVDYKDNRLLTCPHCNHCIRPDIVWFGEGLPQQAWLDAEQTARNCDVFISIGTSALVYPAAGLTSLAKHNGAKVIEINPQPTQSPVVDIQLNAKAGTVLPQLIKQLLKT